MRITNIQRFSLDDGPGIRTTVFCSGCNLRCLWCHNPEVLENKRILFEWEKCGYCRKCEEICPNNAHQFVDGIHIFDREKCKTCMRCIDVCMNEALVINAKEMSIDELVKEIEKDKRFYQKSSGGVTFSGGEPMLQADELETILNECKRRGIHTAIETAGNYPFEVLAKVLEFIDLIIIDCKAYTNEIHKKCTGITNKQIIKNIEKLTELDIPIWVRIPVVFGLNISLEEMEKIASFLKNKRIERVELLPYHKMGISKYKLCGMDYAIAEQAEPSEKELKMCYSILKSHGIAISGDT